MTLAAAVAAKLQLGMPANWATAEQVDVLGTNVEALVHEIRARAINTQPGLSYIDTAALDGSGNGEIRWANNNSAETRVIRRVSVIGKDSAGVPSAAGNVYVYLDGQFVDRVSLLGASANWGDAPVVVRRGQTLVFTCLSGDASDTLFINVFYDRVTDTGE